MKKRLLIIDNDPDGLDVMREIFSESDFEVYALQSTNDIFTDIAACNPHIILVDYLLNDINGGELCHQVKTHPETSHMPVIIISAFPRVIDSLGYYGCDSFISKPFDIYDLINKVEKHCLKVTE